jgi:hypothetical protein
MVRADGPGEIATIAATLAAPAAWPNPATSSIWGMRVHSASGNNIYSASRWGADSYEGGKWAGVSTADQTIYERVDNLDLSAHHTEVAADDRAILQFGAELVSADWMPKGKYSVSLVFTATTID